MRKIVNGVVAVTGGIGLVLLLFGLLVFSLFIQLTIASCKTDIELLQTLGTSPNQLQRFLIKQFLPHNIIIIVAAMLVVGIIQAIVSSYLGSQQIFISKWISWQTAIAGLIIILVIALVNRQTIRKYIRT